MRLRLFAYVQRQGPAINPIINDTDEPLPSLSDWHDHEPNLEFDDTELTHPAPTNGKYYHIVHFHVPICMGGNSGEMCVIRNTFTPWFSLSHVLQTLSLWDIQ